MTERIVTEADQPPVWPNPLVETFDSDWPNLDDDDANVEKWLLEHKQLLMRTVTWNLCAKPPPSVDAVTQTLLPKNKFHIYFVGSEECERSIAQSAINPSKKNWELYLCEALGTRYVPIRSHTLQAIHLMAFVHRSIAHMCTFVTSAAVATGAGNTMGNKGGVGVYLRFAGLQILVVNAHLAAHQNAERQRNNDIHKINRGIPLLLDKKAAQFDQTFKQLAPIAEDHQDGKVEKAAGKADVAATEPVPPTPSSTGGPDGTLEVNGSEDVHANGKVSIPPPIDVRSSVDFGLALITTPLMRKESVQVIGQEEDGEGPLQDTQDVAELEGQGVVLPEEQQTEVAGESQSEAQPSSEAAIQEAVAGSVEGPSEVLVQPTTAAAPTTEEDPGDEDDGDPAEPVDAPVAEDMSSATGEGAAGGEKAATRPRSTSTEVISEMGMTASDRTLDQCGDVVIFMGDLNYRIKGNRAIVSRSLQANMHDVLLNNDQLRWNMTRALVLKNFTEPPLNFRPTYKMDVGTVDTYDTGPKRRIPAWADRILYVNNPEHLHCIAYNSDTSITTSDHKPIYASFVVALDSFVTTDSEQRVAGKRPSPKFTSESQVCNIM